IDCRDDFFEAPCQVELLVEPFERLTVGAWRPIRHANTPSIAVQQSPTAPSVNTMAWLAKSSSTGSVRFGLGPCSQPPRSAPKNQRLQERQGAHQPACGTEILKLLDVRARQMQLRSYVTEPTVDIRRGLSEACGRKAANGRLREARDAEPSWPCRSAE